jgi:hypothetical protein
MAEMFRLCVPGLSAATKAVLVKVVLVVTCGAALSACGGSRMPAADAAAQQVAAATSRLQGTWTLVQFQPETGLEPMMAQLLAVQIGRLTVRFDANQAYFTGVGVNAQRAYRVDAAQADQLHLTLLEDTGATYQIVGAFSSNVLQFRSDTDPWRGRGTLQRGAPPGQTGPGF